MYKHSTAQVWVFLSYDEPTACARCARQTLVLGKQDGVCSRCAGVWTPAERAGMLEAIRRPFPTNPKPHFSSPKKIDRAAEDQMLIDALAAQHEQ
jgi:hypothetical protein